MLTYADLNLVKMADGKSLVGLTPTSGKADGFSNITLSVKDLVNS